MAITAAELMVRVEADTTQMVSDLDRAESRVTHFANEVRRAFGDVSAQTIEVTVIGMNEVTRQLGEILSSLNDIASKPFQVTVQINQDGETGAGGFIDNLIEELSGGLISGVGETISGEIVKQIGRNKTGAKIAEAIAGDDIGVEIAMAISKQIPKAGWIGIAVTIAALIVAALIVAFPEESSKVGQAIVDTLITAITTIPEQIGATAGLVAGLVAAAIMLPFVAAFRWDDWLAEGISRAWPAIDAGLHWLGDQASRGLEAVLNIDWSAVLSSVIDSIGTLASKFLDGWRSTWDPIGALLKQEMGAALEEAGGFLIGGLMLGIQAAIPGIGPVIGPLLMDGLLNLVKRIFGISSPSRVFADEVGGPIVEGLLQGMVNAWGAVTSWVAGIPGALLGAFGGLAGTLVQHGTELITGLWDGAQSAWSSVTGWLGGLAQDALGRLGEFGGSLVQAGTDLLTGLWDGAQSAWGSVTGWLGGLASEAISGIGELLDTLMEKGRDLLNGLWNGAQAVWDGSVAGWMGERAGEALRLIGELTGTLLGKGKDLIGGLLEGLKGFWESGEGVAAWLGRRGDEAVTAVGNVAEKLLEKGKELIQGHWEGMKQLWSGAGSVVEWLGKLGEEAVRAVGSLGKKLFQRGVDLVQGFIDGLNSMVEPVRRAVGVLGDIADGVLGRLGRSPWPMTIAHGRDAGMGFKIGIEEQVPAVQQSAAELGRVAVSSIASAVQQDTPLAVASLAALGTAVGMQLGQNLIDGARAALAEPSNAGVAQQVLASVAPSDEQFAEQGRSGAHALGGGYAAGLTDPALMEQVRSAGAGLIEALDLALAEGGQGSLQRVADLALDISDILKELPEHLRAQLGTGFKLALDEFITNPTEQTRAEVIAQLERISQATALIPRSFADAAPVVRGAIAEIVAQVDGGVLGIDEAQKRIAELMKLSAEEFLKLPAATQEMVQRLAEDLGNGVITVEEFVKQVKEELAKVPREIPIGVSTGPVPSGIPPGAMAPPGVAAGHGGKPGGGAGALGAWSAETGGTLPSGAYMGPLGSSSGAGDTVTAAVVASKQAAEALLADPMHDAAVSVGFGGIQGGIRDVLRRGTPRQRRGASFLGVDGSFLGESMFGQVEHFETDSGLQLLLRLIQSREARGEDITDLLRELAEYNRMIAESTLRQEKERLELNGTAVESALEAFILKVLDRHLSTARS